MSMCLNTRFLLMVTKRHMAGHSKWANIKHIKATKDGERAAIRDRLFRQCRAAIKEQGSADPKQNQKLAHLIEQAHHHNVPAEKIKQILQSSDPAKEDLRNYVFEIRGPGGSFFVCEVVTISHSKSRQSINTINRKLNSSWADGVSNILFSHKGIIKTLPLHENQTLEQALDHAIEAGAEDVTVDKDGNFEFVSDQRDFYVVSKRLLVFGYKTIHSELLYLPLNRVTLSEDDLAAAIKLHDKLSEDPDIVRVYDNIQ